MRLGVVLFQLGGPDSLDAIEPFLANLFNDPDIIDLPLGRLVRRPLARLLASRRAPKVAGYYEAIGGASPLLAVTARQAALLEDALSGEYECRVVVAMRYWKPDTTEAIREMVSFSPDVVVLLPLYPQYSYTTTRSSLNEWARRKRELGVEFPRERRVLSYHDDEGYIDALIERIRSCLDGLSGEGAPHLLFAAHGIPERLVRRGDPYRSQVEGTVRAVVQRGGFTDSHSICYQSKVGPFKWLGPSIGDEIRRLAGSGARALVVVPVSFVSDHLETLYELGMKFKAWAESAGIVSYSVVSALNDSSTFIEALKRIVEREVRDMEKGERAK